MKVLHINNIAGVSSLLVEGIRQKGIEADLIVRTPHPYGYPHEKVVDAPASKFLLYTLRLSRSYDIVHIHGLPYRQYWNIDIVAFRTLGPKLIVHLHGSEIRTSENRLQNKLALHFAKLVLVSTPDLLLNYPKATWLPNPIDPSFKPMGNSKRVGKALYFRKWYETEREKVVKDICAKMGLKLTVRTTPIPYKEMPLFLNKFEVFFDRFYIPSLSKTALEALACGCRVIGWKGEIVNSKEILRNHSLRAVTERLVRIYESIVKSNKPSILH